MNVFKTFDMNFITWKEIENFGEKDFFPWLFFSICNFVLDKLPLNLILWIKTQSKEPQRPRSEFLPRTTFYMCPTCIGLLNIKTIF
jgi:hypothetical protein